MSFIVLKPWALYPAQVFFSSLQLLCIALNSLTLWPDSYPAVGRLTLPPPFSRERGPGKEDPASDSIFLFCLLVV